MAVHDINCDQRHILADQTSAPKNREPFSTELDIEIAAIAPAKRTPTPQAIAHARTLRSQAFRLAVRRGLRWIADIITLRRFH